MAITGLICFGDSIIAGTGASERDYSNAKILKNSLSVPVSLKGRNWNTSQDGLERLETDVLHQKNLSHVIILFGNNDSWLTEELQCKIPLDQFSTNLHRMIQNIRDNNQSPMLCNLQPIDVLTFVKKYAPYIDLNKVRDLSQLDKQALYSAEIESVANKSNVPLINIRSALQKANGQVIAEDGLHPNDLGHKVIAEKILKILKRIDNPMSTI